MARRKARRTSNPALTGRRIPQPTSDDHLALAKELRLAGDENPEERAQNYCEAAENYAMAGDPVTAEGLFHAAMDDGGEVAGGVHGYFASFLFQQDRPDEALAVIEAARKLRPDDSDMFVFEIIAEVLATHGHPRDAAAWATRGLVALYGSLADITADDLEDDPDGAVLAAIRRRARQAADLPADNVDDLAAPDLDSLVD